MREGLSYVLFIIPALEIPLNFITEILKTRRFTRETGYLIRHPSSMTLRFPQLREGVVQGKGSDRAFNIL